MRILFAVVFGGLAYHEWSISGPDWSRFGAIGMWIVLGLFFVWLATPIRPYKPKHFDDGIPIADLADNPYRAPGM